MSSKVCRKCKIEKDNTEFSPSKKGCKLGLSAWCKQCFREYAKFKRSENPENANNIRKKHMQSIGGNSGYYLKYKETINRTQKIYRRKQSAKNSHRLIQARRNKITNDKRLIPETLIQKLINYYSPNNLCVSCGKETEKLELDHVIPLCKGGENRISNLQPLCGHCNRSKYTKSTDYRYDLGYYAQILEMNLLNVQNQWY